MFRRGAAPWGIIFLYIPQTRCCKIMLNSIRFLTFFACSVFAYTVAFVGECVHRKFFVPTLKSHERFPILSWVDQLFSGHPHLFESGTVRSLTKVNTMKSVLTLFYFYLIEELSRTVAQFIMTNIFQHLIYSFSGIFLHQRLKE